MRGVAGGVLWCFAIACAGCGAAMSGAYRSDRVRVVTVHPAESEAALFCDGLPCQNVTITTSVTQVGSDTLGAIGATGELALAVGAGIGAATADRPDVVTTDQYGLKTSTPQDNTLSGVLAGAAVLLAGVGCYDFFLRNEKPARMIEGAPKYPSVEAELRGRRIRVPQADLAAAAASGGVFPVAQRIAEADARQREADEAARTAALAAAQEVERRRVAAPALTWDQASAIPDAELLPEERVRLEELRPAEEARQAAEEKKRATEEAKATKAALRKQAIREKRLRGAIEVGADEVLYRYHQNEVGADALYKNRRVAVTGRVITVGKDFLGAAFLAIGDAESFESVHCSLGWSIQREIASLSPGQQVTVLGRMSGMVLGSPVVSDCQLFQTWR